MRSDPDTDAFSQRGFRPPAPRPVPPGTGANVGQARLMMDQAGEPVGLEVWTGTSWLRLKGVTYAGSLHRPWLPCYHLATVVIDHALPAEQPR